MTRALLLNASYEPHSIVRDRDAVSLYMEGLVDIIEYSDQVFHSPSISVAVPSVARLIKYVVMPEKHRSVLLTTKAVCARDDYVCGYCGGVADTMDHVHPRGRKIEGHCCGAKGRLHKGGHLWENVTASCRRCNHKKRDILLSEIGWTLDRVPFKPKGVAAYLLTMKPEPQWEPYLQVA